MSTRDDPQRLSRIATQWSLVMEAHDQSADGAASARQALLVHYSSSVYRYLLGAVRDPDAAEELSQEFALRLMRGAFRRAAPERGRFRDYVKTVLSNLVNDHFRSKRRLPQTDGDVELIAAESAESAAGPSLEDCLRDNVLERTWAALRRLQPRYHAVLLLRVEQADLSSTETARQLTATTGTKWSADGVRKTLERARTKFADILLDEVSAILDCTDLDDLGEALAELDLLRYCRTALDRRAKTQ
jgi:RNA polymerase sigma-70 factor (ECF subfamily)